MGKKMDIRKLRVRQLMLIIVDILSIIFSLYGSLILRFEGLLEQTYISNINSVLLIVIIFIQIMRGIFLLKSRMIQMRAAGWI